MWAAHGKLSSLLPAVGTKLLGHPCTSLHEVMLSFLLGEYLKVKSLGHVLIVKNAAKTFPKWLYHLLVPKATFTRSGCSPSLPTAGRASVSNLGQTVGYVVVFQHE